MKDDTNPTAPATDEIPAPELTQEAKEAQARELAKLGWASYNEEHQATVIKGWTPSSSTCRPTGSRWLPSPASPSRWRGSPSTTLSRASAPMGYGSG